MKKRTWVAAAGVVILLAALVFWQRRTLFLTADADAFRAEKDTVIFGQEEMERLLAMTPRNYAAAEAVKDGCALGANPEEWEAFLAACDRGEQVCVTAVLDTVEGKPTICYLSYDGSQFYAMSDERRSVSLVKQVLSGGAFRYTYGTRLTKGPAGDFLGDILVYQAD